MHGRVAMFTKGKWSAQARGFPHQLLDNSILSRRLIVGWKARGMKFGRLGAPKITHKRGMEGLRIVLSQQHETNSISASVCAARKEDFLLPEEGKKRGEEPAALRVFLCRENTWKSLTFGLCLLYVHNLNSLVEQI